MPKWVEVTYGLKNNPNYGPHMNNTQSFGAFKGPETDPDNLICLVTYKAREHIAFMTVYRDDLAISVAIDDVETLDIALGLAEKGLVEAGFDPPKDQTSIEWSN